jgi:hypothetical protein
MDLMRKGITASNFKAAVVTVRTPPARVAGEQSGRAGWLGAAPLCPLPPRRLLQRAPPPPPPPPPSSLPAGGAGAAI